MHSSGWVWYREANEADARDDNARLRALLGHCPTSIAVLDENGNLVGYNAEFLSLFATPPPLGEPVGQLFEAEPRAMLARVVALAGTRRRAAAIISLRTRVGEEHDFEFLVATLPGDGPRTIGVVMAADDRTARIHEEGERALAAREIGDANLDRAINLAQSAMCHDINNVLTTLTLSIGDLEEHCATAAPELRATLRELAEAVRHGSDIVRRAKTHSQVVPKGRETTSVRECVERAVQLAAPLARSAKVTIAMSVPSDAVVPLGTTALTQVLTNLVTNSIHAVQDAARPGHVDVTVTHTRDDAITLCVRDDGIGIEPSRLVDSFEAFQTTRATRGGTGLGLAIAREIVEGAGGHIDVLSTPGHSTEMRIALPTVIARIATVA